LAAVPAQVILACSRPSREPAKGWLETMRFVIVISDWTRRGTADYLGPWNGQGPRQPVERYRSTASLTGLEPDGWLVRCKIPTHEIDITGAGKGALITMLEKSRSTNLCKRRKS